MKKKNAKVLLLIISLIMLTGCTKTLTDENKKAVKFEDTGKTLTENVLCRPTEEKVIELYKENGVDTDKLPVCENFKPFDNYEGLWTTIFVKPLAWLLIKVGALLTSINLSKGLANGLAIILSGLAIRLILAPFTKKTAMQSEKLKEIQPQLTKLEAKYKNRTSEEDQKRKAEEMMMIYQKNKINPFSSNWYAYLIFLLLILGTSYLSFRKTLKDQTAMQGQMKGTIYFMLAMIAIATFSLPVALGLYWITSSMFTVVQNKLVEGKKAKK